MIKCRVSFIAVFLLSFPMAAVAGTGIRTEDVVNCQDPASPPDHPYSANVKIDPLTKKLTANAGSVNFMPGPGGTPGGPDGATVIHVEFEPPVLGGPATLAFRDIDKKGKDFHLKISYFEAKIDQFGRAAHPAVLTIGGKDRTLLCIQNCTSASIDASWKSGCSVQGLPDQYVDRDSAARKAVPSAEIMTVQWCDKEKKHAAVNGSCTAVDPSESNSKSLAH